MYFIYLCLCSLVLEHFFSKALPAPVAIFIHGEKHQWLYHTSPNLQDFCHIPATPPASLEWSRMLKVHTVSWLQCSPKHINPFLEPEVLLLAASCRAHQPTTRNKSAGQTDNGLLIYPMCAAIHPLCMESLRQCPLAPGPFTNGEGDGTGEMGGREVAEGSLCRSGWS